MRNKDFDNLIKRTLESAAEEIQENPYEKNKVMNLIKERESSKMRNKKHFSKRAVIVVAAVVCLSATTAFAAGGTLTGWVSHTSLSHPKYASIEEINENSDDFNFTPYAVEEFANGYAFDNACLDQFDGKDAENNTVCTVKELNINYENEDGQKVMLSTEKIPESVDTGNNTAYESEQTYNDIVIKYDTTPYKIVSTDYEPTAEEEALMEAGKMAISYDSDTHHEPEYFNTNSVSWTFNGTDYRIWGFDYDTDLTEAELYTMAQEIIDLQLAK
ncbi:MAG: hypothetical protein ACOX7J_04985 [Bacillota bacterium]|jgi:hypothetical protein